MNSVINKLYGFSLKFVKGFSFILLCILFSGSFLLTCYTADMNTQAVVTRWDNPLLSLAGLILFAAILAAITLFVCRKPQSRKNLLLTAVLLWILGLGALLILFGRSVPAADAMSVYTGAQLLAAGDTSIIHPTDSYFSYYPQQVGLMAFLEVLFRLWNLLGSSLPAYHFIKIIYVLLLCFAVWFQYESVHLLWKSDKADCFYLLLAASNLPMIMYSSFLYGEIPSFCVFSAGLYFLLKFLNLINEHFLAKKSYHSRFSLIFSGICSLFFLTLSVMLRKNTLILIIAILLVLGLEWLKLRRLPLLLLTVSCVICTLSILPITEKFYENRADNILGTGVTAMSYFAMGMQESSRASGWYNGFNFNTYQESGMNTDLANEISRQAILERLDYFRSNPGYAAEFYAEKHLSQWADGTYASRQATIANFGGRHPLLQSVYEGTLGNLYISYCNIHQLLIYLGVLIFCVTDSFTNHVKKEKDTPSFSLPVYTGLIGVIGGFLFHILWEANSRYILIYSLLLIPYAARGLDILTNHIRRSR